MSTLHDLNADDPRLTAYALGALPPEEQALVAAAIEADPVLAAAVDEVRRVAGLIETSLLAASASSDSAAPGLDPARRAAVEAGPAPAVAPAAAPAPRLGVLAGSRLSPRGRLPEYLVTGGLAAAGLMIGVTGFRDQIDRTIQGTDGSGGATGSIAGLPPQPGSPANTGDRYFWTNQAGRIYYTGATSPPGAPIVIGKEAPDRPAFVRLNQMTRSVAPRHDDLARARLAEVDRQLAELHVDDPAVAFATTLSAGVVGDALLQAAPGTPAPAPARPVAPPPPPVDPREEQRLTYFKAYKEATVRGDLETAREIVARWGEASGSVPGLTGLVGHDDPRTRAVGERGLLRALAELKQAAPPVNAQNVPPAELQARLRELEVKKAALLAEIEEAARRERDGPQPENEFATPVAEPSTFAVDVDTASYTLVRQSLLAGELPMKASVRLEELINYFRYEYAPPQDGQAFAAHVEVAACPWAAGRRIVRIGLQGRVIDDRARPPSNLVFLIDVSGSMDDPRKLPLVKSALAALVDRLDGRDRVSIVVYAGASGLVLSPTSGDRKDDLRAALERLKAGGSTNGGAGIELAYELAQKNFVSGGVNRVVLCTDGDFNVGVATRDALVSLVQAKAKTGVFLSVLGFLGADYQDGSLEALADKGNGNYAAVDSEKEAKKVLVEQLTGTLVTIAKDVKVQVVFDPRAVARYRLLGYENRALAARDFDDDTKDAGEIGAGHSVTALYEVEPAAVLSPVAIAPDRLLGTLRLRWKTPAGQTSELIERPITDDGRGLRSASRDLRLASMVAAWGMLLRGSRHAGTATHDLILDLGADVANADALSPEERARRVEWLDLVRRSRPRER